jgi:hypothetical protein
VELDVGIHVDRSTAEELVNEVFEAVSSDLPFMSGDKVGLMIHGLGGTPQRAPCDVEQNLADQDGTVRRLHVITRNFNRNGFPCSEKIWSRWTWYHALQTNAFRSKPLCERSDLFVVAVFVRELF